MPLLIPIFKNSVPCYSSFSTGRPSGKVGHLSQSSTQSHVKTSIRVQALAVSPILVGTWGCVTIKSDVISLRVLLAQWINFSLWRQSWNDAIKNDIRNDTRNFKWRHHHAKGVLLLHQLAKWLARRAVKSRRLMFWAASHILPNISEGSPELYISSSLLRISCLIY